MTTICKKHAFLAILPLAAASIACSPNAPRQEILDEAKFAAVYAAILESSAALHSTSVDSSAAESPARIFQRFGVTEQQFRATIDSYQTEPEKWKAVLELVTKRLEEKARAAPVVQQPLPAP